MKWWHVAGLGICALATYEVCKAVQYDAHRPMIEYVAANYQQPLRIAEIGVLWGRNARRMFDKLDVETMYLIDPFKKYDEYDWREVVVLPASFGPALWPLREHMGRVVPLQMTSEEAADFIPCDLDVVYIDGNHAYDFVKNDIELYYPKVRPGGVIGGHDIIGSPMSCDVQQAVFDFADEHNLQVFVDSPDWWIVK